MIDQFTKDQFEEVLIKAAHYFGLRFEQGNQDSEYTYRLWLDDHIFISVRSSVSTRTGISDGTGQDSIRMYLMHAGSMQNTWLSQIDSLTNRKAGWEDRMFDKIGQLVRLWKESGYCSCGRPTKIHKVTNKANKNYGRLYAKCDLYQGHKDHLYKFL